MTMLKADVKKWIEGTKCFESKDFNGCISALQSANESSKICFTLGMAYYNLNNPSDALYYFSKSTEFDTFLSIGYFMAGVCRLNTNDTDGAYWDFTAALEKMRDHEFIDYTQLKMTYRLLRSEILFNLALSLITGGRDAMGALNEAKNCKEVHEELKTEFNNGIQKMYSGQSSGVKPLTVDKTKVFQPPKVTDMGGAPKPKREGGSSGGSGGSASREREEVSSPPPQKMPSFGGSNSGSSGGYGGGNSGYSSPQPQPTMKSPVPTRSLPPAPNPGGGNRPSPQPGGGGSMSGGMGGSSRPSPMPGSSGGMGGGIKPGPGRTMGGGGGSPNPGFGGGGPRGGTSNPIPMRPTTSIPPTPGRSPGMGGGPRSTPGPSPSRIPTPPQEMLRIKVYYKDKRLVEIPKDSPTFFDLKSRVEQKFTTTGLIIKYQTSNGDVKTISNQRDFDDALSDNMADMYVNKPGETNQFEPQQQTNDDYGSSGGDAWQECYTDNGELYYYNSETQESSWDKPTSMISSRASTGSMSNNSTSTSKLKVNERSGSLGSKSGGGYNGGSSGGTTSSAYNKPKPATSDWVECWTDSGDKYYYNSKTDESSWDPPS